MRSARCWTCCSNICRARFPERYRSEWRGHRSRRPPGPGCCRDAVVAAAPHCLAAGAGRPDPDAQGRERLAAGRRLAVLSVVLEADRKIRQADARDPRAGAGLRAGHAHGGPHRPHVRQAPGRQSGAALQLVDPGGRRDSTIRCPASSASTARPTGRRNFPTPMRPPTPSSASSARRCASCRSRATSCSRSASISIRFPC